MEILLGLENVSHEWPGKQVLSSVSVAVYAGDRIGIVGKNGDGKSTLLNIMMQDLLPDSGSVTYRHGIHAGILGQHDALDNEMSVGQAIVGNTPDYVWAKDPKTRDILSALVSDISWEANISTLSGGERRRVDLARLLIGSWDVLFLDEPTNHLDVKAITWLADHLKHRWRDGEGALLVVTHDRWFLDEVATGMWELHDGEIEPFEGGFSAYIQQRVEREALSEVREAKRRNALRKELNWLSHGAKARTSKPRFRVEAARALIACDPPLRNSLELKRLAVARLGKQVIDIHHMSHHLGNVKLINNLDWLIGPGERIGILGANGAGKTTLLKLLTGRLKPDEGKVCVGKSVRLGWMSQQLDILDTFVGYTVSETLKRYKTHVFVEGKETSSEKLLERLGFSRKDFSTRIVDLSGGQRRRLALLLVLLEEPNVLILDEPGNDLDTYMLAEMESLLDSWPGTLLLVTHDRYLMERVTDNQYALINGILAHLPGGVDEYLEKLRSTSFVGQTSKASDKSSQTHSSALLSSAKRQEKKRRLEAVVRLLNKYEHEPQKLEAELADLDQSDYLALLEMQEKIDAAKRRISELEDEWITLTDELGE